MVVAGLAQPADWAVLGATRVFLGCSYAAGGTSLISGLTHLFQDFSFFHESVPAPFHEWLDSPLFQELGFLHHASCVVDACEDAAGSGAAACAVAAAPGRGI